MSEFVKLSIHDLSILTGRASDGGYVKVSRTELIHMIEEIKYSRLMLLELQEKVDKYKPYYDGYFK